MHQSFKRKMLYEDANGAIWYLSEKRRPKLLYSEAKILFKLTASEWILEVNDRLIIHEDEIWGSISKHSKLYKLAKNIDYKNLVFSQRDRLKYIFIFKHESQYTLWVYNEGYDRSDYYEDALEIDELEICENCVFAQLYGNKKILAITSNRKLYISINEEFKILKKCKRNTEKPHIQLCNGAYFYYDEDDLLFPDNVYIYTPSHSSDEINYSKSMKYLDSHNGYVLSWKPWGGIEYCINGNLADDVPFATNLGNNIKSARNI